MMNWALSEQKFLRTVRLLEFHLQNPALVKYLGDSSPLLDFFTIELYGEVSKNAFTMLMATGTLTEHYDTEFGFIRGLTL